LQIFYKTVNIEIGIVFIPAQIFLTQTILVCNVALLFEWDGMQTYTKLFLVFCTSILFVSWSVFLSLGGLLHKEAAKTVGSWKLENWHKKEDRMYMKRAKKTCLPIAIGDGKRFVIDSMKVLRFGYSVSKNTFRAAATYVKVFGC